jgi:hypothetical protein
MAKVGGPRLSEPQHPGTDVRVPCRRTPVLVARAAARRAAARHADFVHSPVTVHTWFCRSADKIVRSNGKGVWRRGTLRCPRQVAILGRGPIIFIVQICYPGHVSLILALCEFGYRGKDSGTRFAGMFAVMAKPKTFRTR